MTRRPRGWFALPARRSFLLEPLGDRDPADVLDELERELSNHV